MTIEPFQIKLPYTKQGECLICGGTQTVYLLERFGMWYCADHYLQVHRSGKCGRWEYK